MIFVDESGKRWKKIKATTMVGAGISGVTLTALVIGSLVTPGWGQISILKQAEKAISSSGQTAINSITQAAHASTPNTKSSKNVAALTSTAKTTSSTPSPKPTATATPSPSPAVTPTPVVTPVTSKKDYGTGHNPSR